MIALETEMDEFTARLKKDPPLKKSEMKRERKKREHQRAVQSRREQTCHFWQQQVVKENTEQNRAYRDAACTLYQ